MGEGHRGRRWHRSVVSERTRDCSGFVQELLQILGIDPAGDQNAQALHDYFMNGGTISQSADIIGSLCFYGNDLHHITHVAMVIAEDRIIEAGGGDSKTLSLAMAVSQNAFVRVRHFRRRKDLLRILIPKNLPF